MNDYLAELRHAIYATHGVNASHRETVAVSELSRAAGWDGAVEVFDLSNHPTAKQCFAWGVRRDDDRGWDVTSVLGIQPVVTPDLAVRAAIVAKAHGY